MTGACSRVKPVGLRGAHFVLRFGQPTSRPPVGHALIICVSSNWIKLIHLFALLSGFDMPHVAHTRAPLTQILSLRNLRGPNIWICRRRRGTRAHLNYIIR